MKICSKLKPPSPKQLGWTKSGALGSRAFSSSDSQKTWEDWEEYVKKHYPIRYFIFESIPDWFSYNIYYPLERFYWYLRDKLWTRHYLLDLRQGYNGYDKYSHGFIDCDRRMLFACFNSLKDYIEKEDPKDICDQYSWEEIEKDEFLLNSFRVQVAAKSLYNYWMVGRKKHQDTIKELQEKVNSMTKDNPDFQLTKEAWFEELRKFDEKEDKMLQCLIKIRRSLWT